MDVLTSCAVPMPLTSQTSYWGYLSFFPFHRPFYRHVEAHKEWMEYWKCGNSIMDSRHSLNISAGQVHYRCLSSLINISCFEKRIQCPHRCEFSLNQWLSVLFQGTVWSCTMLAEYTTCPVWHSSGNPNSLFKSSSNSQGDRCIPL